MNDTQTNIDNFAAAVQQNLTDKPFTIERTPEGFNTTIDLANTKWWMPLSRNGLKDSFTYEVHCDEATKTYSITDTQRRVEWRAGVNPDALEPYFNLNYSYQSGRSMNYQRKIVIGGTDQGTIEPVVDIDFSSRPQREAIRAAAANLGWKEKMGSNQKIGLIFAIGAGVLVLAILVVLLIVGLSGGLSSSK